MPLPLLIEFSYQFIFEDTLYNKTIKAGKFEGNLSAVASFELWDLLFKPFLFFSGLV